MAQQRELAKNGQPKVLVTDPEYTFSIVGLVASFCGQSIVGLVLTSIALKKSREAGRYNGYALTGFVISIVMTAIGVMAFFGYFVLLASLIARSHFS